ncbi:MAG: hypothetical protein AAFW82_08350 [Pseudomonadota bacterium]
MDANLPDRPEPQAQRFARPVEQRAGRDAGLMTAGFVGAFEMAPIMHQPQVLIAASRA